MCCSRLKSQSENLQDFVCSRKKLVVLSACAIFVLICGLILKTSPANANVCFLPDPSMCDDGEIDRNGPPGGDGTTDPDTSTTDICEGYTATFSSDELPQNACGDACRRCEDPNSPNFGKYLCPESTCGWCDRDGGYTSIKEQNRCGESCVKCNDTHSKSFGRYKCPAETCDECVGYDKTETQIKKERCINCVPCPYDNTRYKCTTCNVCSGYPYSLTDYQVTSGAYDCERCSDGDWYKCTPRGLCGDFFDYTNDMTSPSSETFNTYGKRHITCSQCTSSGKYDTRYGYFYCQDDGCQGYNTHQSDTKITSGEYACCQCSPQYLAHDSSLDQNRFRVDNGNWYNSCEEYCKSSEDNFFTVDYLRNGKYSCSSVKTNKYPDAIGERTATIRLSCGNKTHSCYYPTTVCPVDEYKWTSSQAAAKASDDHYKKDPCTSCNDSTSCVYLDYKCDDPMCDPRTYTHYKSDFAFNYARNYLGNMAGYDPDTCSNCLATGRSESSRLYDERCSCVTVPNRWYNEDDYENKFYRAYGYSFSISDDYSYTTSGCEPIYSCGVWYYNYSSTCMINHCNTSWSRTSQGNFQSHPTDGNLYGFKFNDTSCYCQYLDKIYYNSGSTACYNDCSSCALDYGYDESYNNNGSYVCNFNCTDCSGNNHYDCDQCEGGGSTDCTGGNNPGQWYVCSSSCVNCAGKTLYSGCTPKDCPTGEVKESSCSGNFYASGSYSGTTACGHCCNSGYHWDGSQCVVDSCPAGTVTGNNRDSCSNYTLETTMADGTECYTKTGDKAAYCDGGWSLTAGTCYSSSKNAYCAKNGEKCYNNKTTPVCGTNESLYGAPTNCHCDCGDGYCKNSSDQCVAASGLNCPSDTTSECYSLETTTVSSGSCTKNCTYKVDATPSCGNHAHKTGSGTTCSCECDSGYHGDPFTGCSENCTPSASESPNASTCKTQSYSCSDNCGGTRTCYKYACSSSQTCYNSSCCTPSWPSYQGYDTTTCMTKNDGTVSDGCGNTRAKYKYACTNSQTCYNNSCCTPNWPSYQGYDYNNCMTVSDGSVSDGCGNTRTKYKSKCSSGQSCNGSGSCVNDCAPWANESPNSSTCTTQSYSCDDHCGGTRTCYKYACTDSQTCYNNACCTPSWPSYQGYDYNNCMTVEDGTVSDGCGHTATKYKSACNAASKEVCNGSGSCVTSISCDQSQNQYADEQDCDYDWHDWWSCYYNRTTGCWFPICNESNGYYDDQQTCEVETDKTCALVKSTQNYIPCYAPLDCDPGEEQYATSSECDDIWDGHYYYCYKISNGCWTPYCDDRGDYYDDMQDCEVYGGFDSCEVVPDTSSTAHPCYTEATTSNCVIDVFLVNASYYGWNGYGYENIYVSTSQESDVPISIDWTAREKCWGYDYHSETWSTSEYTRSGTARLYAGETDGDPEAHHFNDGTSAAGDEISGDHCEPYYNLDFGTVKINGRLVQEVGDATTYYNGCYYAFRGITYQSLY